MSRVKMSNREASSSRNTTASSKGKFKKGSPKTIKESTEKKKVAFFLPDEIQSVEVAVIDPVNSSFYTIASNLERQLNVNCFFVNQTSRLCICGVPLSDICFAFFSFLLLTSANVLLILICLSLAKRNDIMFAYVLAWLIVDRLATVIYRYWSATENNCMCVIFNIFSALIFIDSFITAISLLCAANRYYMVNLVAAEGSDKSRKQWTALPFLSGPGRLITRMKMLCLLSATTQCWQIMGLMIILTDRTRPTDETESLKIIASITCSIILLCWAATCGLPTRPIAQLLNSGYCVVFRTALKMSWLLSTAASRLITFYIFSTAFQHILLILCCVQWLLVFSYSLVVTRCSILVYDRPSLAKLFISSSIYLLIFVHPQKGHLTHGYGLFHFFYLCENLILLYIVIDLENLCIMWVFVTVGFYSLGILCLLGLMMVNALIPHKKVFVDRNDTEPKEPSTSLQSLS